MAQNEIAHLHAKAQQFRMLAQTYQTKISARLVEIAAELEARARMLERGGSEPMPLLEEVQLQEQVNEALRLANDRAEAGDGRIAAKLIEFAAEMQVKCDQLDLPTAERLGRAAQRARQFRLQAEEGRTIAEATKNAVAREMLILGAESCELMAASLERAGMAGRHSGRPEPRPSDAG
jgi:hypothetical protein